MTQPSPPDDPIETPEDEDPGALDLEEDAEDEVDEGDEEGDEEDEVDPEVDQDEASLEDNAAPEDEAEVDAEDETKTSHFATIEVQESGTVPGTDGLPLTVYRADIMLADGDSVIGFGASTTAAAINALHRLINQLQNR